MLTPDAVTGSPVTSSETVTPPLAGPLSVRAYARHRGTSAPSVLRAIKRGRLKASLVIDEDGKAKIADVALADAEWEANTDLSRAPGYVKERAAKPGPRRHGETSALAEASTREKDARAKLAELEYLRKAGTLVDAKQIETHLVDVFTQCRSKLLGLPSKTKALIPHLSAAEVLVIDNLVREVLEELASLPVTANGAAA